MEDWLPEGHLALFVSDALDELVLSEGLQGHASGPKRSANARKGKRKNGRSAAMNLRRRGVFS